jgi:glyoxylase-like metal-dependent hydrolase (beta-lactamase superfamily II)
MKIQPISTEEGWFMGAQKNLLLTLALVLSLFAFTAQIGAQAPQDPPVKVAMIKDNVYWAQGGAGSNNGFIVGKTSVVLVDTKSTVDSEKQVIAEIAKITPKTVKTVLITHSDGDHVDGLAAFPAGLTIISSEACKQEMIASAGSRDPAPQDRLPTKTFDKTDKLTIDGVHVRLYHLAGGHTGGDAVVYLPDQKIVFGGDQLTTGMPDIRIKLDKNGSTAGWIENMKNMIALDSDIYVTGHGDLLAKADVQKKLDQVEAKYNKIKAMFADGKSLADIKEALGETNFKLAGPPRPTFTETVYMELSKKS